MRDPETNDIIPNSAILPESIVQNSNKTLKNYFTGIREPEEIQELELPWKTETLKNGNLFKNWTSDGGNNKDTEFNKLINHLTTIIIEGGTSGAEMLRAQAEWGRRTTLIKDIIMSFNHLLKMSKNALEYIIIQEYREKCFHALIEKNIDFASPRVFLFIQEKEDWVSYQNMQDLQRVLWICGLHLDGTIMRYIMPSR